MKLSSLSKYKPSLSCATKVAVPLIAMLAFASAASAQVNLPSLTINTLGGKDLNSQEIYSGLKLTLLVSVMVFIPALLMVSTCFTRIAIVLSMTRQALGTQQTPPNQIVMGLALFLTFSIMQPVFTKAYTEAIVPYSEDQLGVMEAGEKLFAPFREFMLLHTREQDLSLFIDITKTENPETPEKLGPLVVIPAFVISELNSAFQIAFLIYLPFVILDMIISSVLTSMSMITLPPTVISLPIKLMLFVIIDGWHLIIGNLVKSYHGA
jgi:flagellar biosynthetic protein FliP